MQRRVRLMSEILTILILVGCRACAQRNEASHLYDQDVTIPGRGGIEVNCDKDHPGPFVIPLGDRSSLSLNLTGTVLTRYGPGGTLYIVEIAGDLQSAIMVTKSHVFSVSGKHMNYGDVDSTGNIKLRDLMVTKSDTVKMRYVAFESQPKGSMRITLFQVLGFPGLSSIVVPEQIEIPFLERNGDLRTGMVSVLKASLPELLYYAQKSRFFPVIDSCTNHLHKNKRARETHVLTDIPKSKLSTVDYSRQFLDRFQKQYRKTTNPSDLAKILAEVIVSVRSGQAELSDLQKQAFLVSSSIFWLCCARYDFSSPIPRLEKEQGSPVITGNPEVLINLLYNYWISKNPNVPELPFKNKIVSLVYPSLVE
jgi:hypothetical protein